MGINHNLESPELAVFVDELVELVDSVVDREGAVRLIEKLREGLRLGFFEYIRPDGYLLSMELTLKSMPGNCALRNVPCPDPPSWHLIADTLDRAMWRT